jgi:hypothetical protein
VAEKNSSTTNNSNRNFFLGRTIGFYARLIPPLYGFAYRERCEKFRKPFDLSNLCGGGTGIALQAETVSSHHGNVNSKIYVKEKIYGKRLFLMDARGSIRLNRCPVAFWFSHLTQRESTTGE